MNLEEKAYIDFIMRLARTTYTIELGKGSYPPVRCLEAFLEGQALDVFQKDFALAGVGSLVD